MSEIDSRRIEEQGTYFTNRLKKRFRHLWKWARRIHVSAFRVYHRDIPELPFAVDWYDGHLHIAEYDRPHSRSTDEHREWVQYMVKLAGDALTVAPDRVFVKLRERQTGKSQYETLDSQHYELEVDEYGLRFKVNLTDYIDTGLFLDHRDLRRYVGERSSGKSVLNLFGYTGSFTVYAAAGGARSTVTVDLSNTYLDWARENMNLNGLMGLEHQFVRADAREWIADAGKSGRRFDTIILDPPTFSNSKRMEGTLDIQRDHVQLIDSCARLLKPRGEILFSTNRRNFRLLDRETPDLEFRKITRLTMPEDFAGTGIHQAWIIRHRRQER